MRVWLFSGYGDNGGAHMNYQIGVICQEHFGLDVYNVLLNDLPVTTNNMEQEQRFKSSLLSNFLESVEKNDLVIANPSHSNLMLGLRVPCKKIMYVQGFSTFSSLDVHFDQYIAVSNFVSDYLRHVYKLGSQVISAFIQPKVERTPFFEKKNCLLLYKKSDDFIYKKGADMVRKVCVDLKMDMTVITTGLSASSLHGKLNESKYFCSLSVSEGFGLVPLEVMYYGGIVFGLDGYGGKHFMRPKKDCFTVDFKRFDDVGEVMYAALRSQKKLAKVSQKAQLKAEKYTQDAFVRSWRKVLRQYIR